MLSSVSWARTSSIEPFTGFTDVAEGSVSLFTQVEPGTDPDAPIFVLLNGLTQDMDMWDTTIPYLQKKGATVVTIDGALQGRSMIKRLEENSLPHGAPCCSRPSFFVVADWDKPPIFPATTVEEQATYLKEVLEARRDPTKPVVLLGLSYGGGEALRSSQRRIIRT